MELIFSYNRMQLQYTVHETLKCPNNVSLRLFWADNFMQVLTSLQYNMGQIFPGFNMLF